MCLDDCSFLFIFSYAFPPTPFHDWAYMYPLFPAGISVSTLMWLMSRVVCVGRPLTPVCVCVCVCVAGLRWRGTCKLPFLLWLCLDVVCDPGAHHKPADPGTNAAVKHQSWQPTQTLLITAGCVYVCVCVCVCVSHYANVHCSRGFF